MSEQNVIHKAEEADLSAMQDCKLVPTAEEKAGHTIRPGQSLARTKKSVISRVHCLALDEMGFFDQHPFSGQTDPMILSTKG